MHSCLYEGTVRHTRLRPVRHAFRYSLFMVYLDLAECDALFGRRGLWSQRWPALARFRRSDHLGDPHRPLDECVRELVEARLGWRPCGPIRLLTHLRYGGVLMNPISLYYCFDDSGDHVEGVVADVTNTPWNERHQYVLDLRGQAASRGYGTRSDKTFHVSPFMQMDLQYRWRLSAPRERLAVSIEAHRPGEDPSPIFSAALELRRVPLNRWQCARVLMRYPLMTWQVYAAIYWQALRLWCRGVPPVPHPKHTAPSPQEAPTVPRDFEPAQSASDPVSLPMQESSR